MPSLDQLIRPSSAGLRMLDDLIEALEAECLIDDFQLKLLRDRIPHLRKDKLEELMESLSFVIHALKQAWITPTNADHQVGSLITRAAIFGSLDRLPTR